MRCLWFLLFIGWTSYGRSAMQDEATPFQRLILSQCSSHPKLGLEDLYKFTFQAALGNEHLMTDTVSLLKYLTNELASLSPGNSSEPLFEYLTPDSSLVRYNLRPFKARNGDPASLIRAMLVTASTFVPSTQRLENWMEEMRELAERRRIPFSEIAVSEYFSSIKREGYPAVHHSPGYEVHYRPAYRVLAKNQVSTISFLQK